MSSQRTIDLNFRATPVVPIVPIAIPKPGKMFKVRDLLEEVNLKNNVDIVAVIAKVGDLKLATQTTRGTVPAREIYLYDDSWAMIKLIARDVFAESSVNFKPGQVLYIRNVKPMKLRGYVVLATMADTFLSHEESTPEAVSLKFWLTQNNLEFKQDGFKKFINLSLLEDKNASQPTGIFENSNKELPSSQSSQASSTTFSQSNNINNTSSTNSANSTNGNNDTSNMKVEKNPIQETEKLKVLDIDELKKRKLSEDENTNVKCIKIDLTGDATDNKEDNSNISDSVTQKASVDHSYTAIVEKTNTKDSKVIVINSDENGEQDKVTNPLKKEVLENEDSDPEVVDNDEDFIVCETYKTLISSVENWNLEKDKYLVNFLSKYCTKQATEAIYINLIQANLNVFQDISVEKLKKRAEILASAKNYVYLLKLCGGEQIKNEAEKRTFVAQVERLRKIMRSKEIKEESND